MTVRWPQGDGALLLWSQLLLTWVVAVYYAGRTSSIWGRMRMDAAPSWWKPAWKRLALLVVVPLWLHGRDVWEALAIAAAGCILAIGLTYARERGRASWRSYGAEIELAATGAFILASALAVGDGNMRPLLPVLELPVAARRVAAVVFATAIVMFLIRGGTQVVRAILNKAGTLPDEPEFNRGRLIGSIERVLLAGMAAVGGYAALGFTIAAKGLVRSRSFEDRDFAEYFLIGTLASTMIALAGGGMLRLVFVNLW